MIRDTSSEAYAISVELADMCKQGLELEAYQKLVKIQKDKKLPYWIFLAIRETTYILWKQAHV